MRGRRPLRPHTAPIGSTPSSLRDSYRRGIGGDIAAAASPTVMPSAMLRWTT